MRRTIHADDLQRLAGASPSRDAMPLFDIMTACF
jgi:hypothetical protein